MIDHGLRMGELILAMVLRRLILWILVPLEALGSGAGLPASGAIDESGEAVRALQTPAAQAGRCGQRRRLS
ncbi:hypothetical protein B7R22_00735 [Subtercola boreus]|uniref:Uncharacterized protein n=1 Tax=Subtercola boreus TaxID=120213 RepID=A0A3E0W633_9MICO|nr:hypothetical protein B7R22_00735 [Subtercola boreus]